MKEARPGSTPFNLLLIAAIEVLSPNWRRAGLLSETRIDTSCCLKHSAIHDDLNGEDRESQGQSREGRLDFGRGFGPPLEREANNGIHC